LPAQSLETWSHQSFKRAHGNQKRRSSSKRKVMIKEERKPVVLYSNLSTQQSKIEITIPDGSLMLVTYPVLPLNLFVWNLFMGLCPTPVPP
jgi:hypothetical protein